MPRRDALPQDRVPRTRGRRLAGGLVVGLAVAGMLLALAAELRAEDPPKAGTGTKKDTSKVPQKGAPHLAFQKTYEAALLEARIRNVPVFVSRHKDF